MWNFKSTGRVKTVDSQNPNVQGNVETYRSLTQAEYDELSYEEKHSGIVYFITDGATDHIAASSIRYDNSGTHIASTSVQGAIDALDAMLGAIGDGDLSELESIISSAEVVLDEVQPILPTSSGTTGQVLTKTASGADWQDATGGGGSGGNFVEMTQAQYNALTNPDPDTVYFITDEDANTDITASGVEYDNTDSGMTATTVQGAIDENAMAIETLTNILTDVNIASVTRIATTATTGSTGNIALPYSPYSNDGKKYIVAPFALQNSYLRAWVAQANNSWYLTAVDPNTGATINNTSLDIRYLLITLKTM